MRVLMVDAVLTSVCYFFKSLISQELSLFDLPIYVIFLPLMSVGGYDEARWKEAESQPEAWEFNRMSINAILCKIEHNLQCTHPKTNTK